MTQLEQIKQEVNRQLQYSRKKFLELEEPNKTFHEGRSCGLINVLNFIDTVQESADKTLEQAANDYVGFPQEPEEYLSTVERRKAFLKGFVQTFLLVGGIWLIAQGVAYSSLSTILIGAGTIGIYCGLTKE